MNIIDKYLNNFTMYRVVLYGLTIICIAAFIFSFFGLMYHKPLNLVASFLILGFFSFISNQLFSKILKIPTNFESSIITFLILFLILTPIQDIQSIWVYILAPFIAMGSKYLIKIHKKHIFNPAVISLFILSFMGAYQVEWWVGNKYLFPIVLVIGLLIVRKIRKIQMFSTFIIFSIISISIFAFLNKMNPYSVVSQAIISWPMIFLGTIMLTEPSTTPSKKLHQILYGGFVGFLTGVQFNLGPLNSSSEFALVAGNIFSYLVSFRKRIEFSLKDKKEIGKNIYEFVFTSNEKFNFLPGQYMEWTLPHKNFDNRGLRRYFSIASGPSEKEIKLGIKIDNDKKSSFKNKLLNLKNGDKIFAGNLAGDFILSKNNKKYVFIAGGIGITPFRSIIKNALDNHNKLDVVLFYSASSDDEFVYKDIFESAKEIGLKTIYVSSHPSINFKGIKGRIDDKLLISEVPDFKDRSFYLSGPNVMVENYKKLLRSLGIRPDKIITDYFSGY